MGDKSAILRAAGRSNRRFLVVHPDPCCAHSFKHGNVKL
jgi:hypothetical protein